MGIGKEPDASSSSLSVVNCPVSGAADNLRATVPAKAKSTSSSSSSNPPDSVSFPSDQLVDFIGSSHAVKDLFSLPYSSKEINVAVHNLNGTLIIDAAGEPEAISAAANGYDQRTGPVPPPASRSRRRPSGKRSEQTARTQEHFEQNGSRETLPERECQTNKEVTSLVSLPSETTVSQQSDALELLTSMIQEEGKQQPQLHDQGLLSRLESYQDSNHASVRVPSSGESTTNDNNNSLSLIPSFHEPREYIQWKFRDMNMLIGSDALIYRAEPPTTTESTTAQKFLTPLTIRVEDVSKMRDQLKQHEQMVRTGKFIPDHRLAEWQQLGKPSYAEALQSTSTQLVENNDKHKATKDDNKVSSFSVPDLDRVQLQTCIVPSSNTPLGGLLSQGPPPQKVQTPDQLPPESSSTSPACAVLDAYLDNIMANVPQLALCLREKGFVQSVKLLRTDQIPSGYMKASTLDTSSPFDVISNTQGTSATDENIFSPQIMEMNASTLLRFLKANCSVDKSTYLFRREAGHTNIQLYDVSAISAQRQRKWIWWLAMMSYRFALRLRHLAMNINAAPTLQDQKQPSSKPQEGSIAALKRSFRARQRSLLQNTFDLLEQLVDMEGASHETLIADVCEKLADTFLAAEQHTGNDIASELDETNNETKTDFSSNAGTSTAKNPLCPVAPATVSSSQQPYNGISVDSLNKAQDHLVYGINKLWKTWEQATQEAKEAERKRTQRKTVIKKLFQSRQRQRQRNRQNHQVVVSIVNGDSSNSSSDSSAEEDDNDENREDDAALALKLETVTSQLCGMHSKLINVSLRLAEHHLNNYFSSSAMQSLRTAARRIADALNLLRPLLVKYSRKNLDEENPQLLHRIQDLHLQYTRLWEHCGHFARSFAADDLWRERGHACGDDIISVLCDVEAAFPSNPKDAKMKRGHYKVSTSSLPLYFFSDAIDPLYNKTNGMIKLQPLSAVVIPPTNDIRSSAYCGKDVTPPPSVVIAREEGLQEAKKILEGKRPFHRDKWQVLVASCISYSRAIVAFQSLKGIDNGRDEEERVRKNLGLRGSPVSNKESPDHTFLNLLQQRLGDACNETGKVLLTELRRLLMSLPRLSSVSGDSDNSEKTANGSDNKVSGLERAAESLLLSAEFWFLEGLTAFESCKDLRNIALLRCNLCQCYKLRANSNFATAETMTMAVTTTTNTSPSSEGAPHAEICLQKAAAHLQAAHENLSVREVDPLTWDMVSEELAATLLVLGVRRRQSFLGGGNAPVILQVLRLSPGKENSIVDPMDRALKIYEQSGNAHQAAAVHYQLALFYSKIWTCQRDEAKTREKLSAAFLHYNSSHAYFANSLRGNEPTFVLLCLDLSSLYAAVSGEECLSKALARCLDTLDAFSSEAINSACQNQPDNAKREWLEKMETLATSVEDRIFKLLRSLVKEEAANGAYKVIYRSALTAKMGAQNNQSLPESEQIQDVAIRKLSSLYEIMSVIKKQLGELCQK